MDEDEFYITDKGSFAAQGALDLIRQGYKLPEVYDVLFDEPASLQEKADLIKVLLAAGSMTNSIDMSTEEIVNLV